MSLKLWHKKTKGTVPFASFILLAANQPSLINYAEAFLLSLLTIILISKAIRVKISKIMPYNIRAILLGF